jgi:hypothetical protein
VSLLSRVPFRLTRALLLPGLGVASRALSAALTLAGLDEHILRLDAGASNRNVTLDTAAQNKGRWYIVRNYGAANNLVMKDGADTIATLAPGDVGLFACDGTDWFAVAVLRGGAQTFTGLQTFADGIVTDTIAEETSAAGVTVDGCLIKDGRAANLATGAMFISSPVTGNGAPQNTAHGFGAAPSLAFAVPVDLTGGVFAVVYGTHDATNCVFTATNLEKYRVIAFR